MPELKQSFRASYGLDAAGEKVINVAMADKNVMTDGINVEYLIQENTVQPYDPARGYPKNFVVVYSDRLWISEVVITKPAGTFNEVQWRPVRTDPKWKPINSGVYQLAIGDYITVDTELGQNVEFTLPSNAQEGDNITIKDVGGRVGVVDLIIKAGVQSIYDKGQRLQSTQMTIPFSEWVFVYVNRMWNLYNGAEADLARYVKTGETVPISCGETIIRQYVREEAITLVFPKNANNGDMIHFVGMENKVIPYYNLVLKTYDANTSIMQAGKTTQTIRRSLSGYFIFNSTTKIWTLYDTDMTDRLRTVGADTVLFPGETVSVVGQDNTTVANITLTLPTNVNAGDKVTVALNYIRKNQTVNIVPGGTDKILTNENLTQFPKRSSYPPNGNWVNATKLTYNGGTDYPPIITFAYLDMGPIKQWMVVQNVPALERVDPTDDATRARLGVIALANQSQANLDHEDITVESKEVAITPETLANRTATETRRGILRVGTTAQNSYDTGSALYADDLIVTPKKLDAKQATEKMRGLAEIAEQSEANGSTDDQRIITAKKLDARRATDSRAGVAPLVKTGGAPGTKVGENRDVPGTLVYNYNDYANIVTPKTLRELKAVEQSAGIVFLATEAEVIAGTEVGAAYPIAVTPLQLHKKTAQEGRIGFTQIAKQDEVDAGADDFKYVTPKKLAGRIARDDLTGLARYATQGEFDLGTGKLISDPARIKTFFSRTTRTAVESASGLTQIGNLWTTTKFDIVLPTFDQRGTTRLATQGEVDVGTQGNTIVTPQTLHAKKSTTTAEGIIRVANTAETNTGTSVNTAICPLNLKHMMQVQKEWEAQTTVRGPVKMTEGALTWVGNDTVGNTQPLDSYQKTGYAISPYELNKTLANYAPLKSKAVDSDKLDGLDSTQFVRRDIDQTVNGALTLTQPLLNNSDSDLRSTLTVGNSTNAKDILYPKIFLRSHANNAGMVIGTKLETNGTVKFVFGYSGDFQNAKDTNNISFPSFEYSHAGNVNFYQNVDVDKNMTAGVDIVANRSVYTKTGNYYIGAANNIVAAMGTDPNNLLIGNTTNNTYIRTANANSLMVQDAGSNYQILNQKNMQTLLNPIYVNKTGDTMSGRLTISAPIVATIPQTSAPITTVPVASNFGTWTISVDSSTIYDKLPGYVVPVYDKSEETGETLPWISHYDEFKGPGTLSQFGSSASSGVGTYQIWAPRPAAVADNHNAQTFHMRHWNPVKNAWDGWGRVYTSNTPPTAKDIGAMSNNGSVFDSMRIRDWIQVGNLRIYADPTTKTVRFDWIE